MRDSGYASRCPNEPDAPAKTKFKTGGTMFLREPQLPKNNRKNNRGVQF